MRKESPCRLQDGTDASEWLIPADALARFTRGYCRWLPPEQACPRTRGRQPTDVVERDMNEQSYRKYSTLVPVIAGLLDTTERHLDEDLQEQIVQACFSSRLTEIFPPSWEYRRRFLVELVRVAEASNSMVSDSAMDHLSKILNQPELEKSWGYQTYFYQPRFKSKVMPSSGQISLRVSPNMLEGSTGCYQWEAGFLMGQFVLSNPLIFSGKRCLELGCGSGLCGVCLHKVGAAHITLTDGDPRTVDNCWHNLSCNGAAKGSDVLFLEWGISQSDIPEADVVFGADLLYDPGSIHKLVVTISQILNTNSDAYVVLAICKRNPASFALFEEALKDACLMYKRLDESLERFSVCFLDILDDFTADMFLIEIFQGLSVA